MCVPAGPPPTLWQSLSGYLPSSFLIIIGVVLLFLAIKRVHRKLYKVNLFIVSAILLLVAIVMVFTTYFGETLLKCS